MSYYLGRLYVGKRDVYLAMAVVLLGIAVSQGYLLPLFQPWALIILSAVLFCVKGLIFPAYNAHIFLTFLIGFMLLLFIPPLEVVYFLLFSLGLLKLTKAV